MGKGRPRAVEKGVGHAPASAGSLIVPPAPVFHPTEEEFKDPLAFIDKIRPQAELFGICRIVPPPSWSPPPFSPDLNSLKFPTKAQAIHRLQSRPADCDPHTFALEYRRFLATHLGRNLSRWRPPVFEGADLDLCLLFNAVKRFGGYDRVCKEKRWGDVFPLVRPGAVPTACSKHVLSQLYCEHLCDYEDHLARLNRTTKKSKGSSSSDQKVMKRSLTQPEKPGGKRRKGSAGERVVKDEFDQICEQCKSGLHGEVMLLCDRCDKGWHLYCLTPPLESIPSGNWYCQDCVNSGKDSFGFVPAKCCSVEAFQRMDDRARRKWFGQGHATRSEIEKRFWDIVEGRSGEVEVMYGNDLDTSRYGSGFPRASDPIPASVDPEKWKEYCASPWNLNNLPKLQGSMLRAVHDNIAGVMVPWLYIGMLFSSFCWHVEDHCLYSINYLHWGEPKRWYGVPGGEANAFEQVMRKTLPDLFDAQPDLLFQLVTMLSPSVLQENGVPVYGVVQEPGNFVITFPRSFHGGFNFGLNCAEAVNFAPADWLPHGGFGAELYRVYHKAAVLSHEELLYVVAKNGCDTKALPYLKEEMHRIFAREKRCREELWRNGIVRSSLMSPKKHPLYVGTEEDPTCIICQQYLYLSAITCGCRPSAFVCLEHWKHLCECNPNKRRLLYRHTLAELHDLVQMCSHVNETCVAAEKPTSKIPHLHQTAHNESSPMRKKVKVGLMTYTQLAEDWLLKSCDIRKASFSKVAYSTALKEAEQFLWADHDMDPVRDVANKLTEIQKWALNVRSCLSKIDLCCHKDDLEKVSILEVEKLLGFDSSCCFEPELNKLKAYAGDARMLVGEIQSVLSSQLHVEELELVFSRAVAFPIYVEETGKLAREISSAKVWRKNAKECLSERRPGALKIEFLDKLRSEMLELHVQIPEKKLLLDFCREVESWQTRCKKTVISSLKLKELEGFLHDAENVTVSIPELELLRQFLHDAHSWIHHVHDVLQNISERDDHENVIQELSCILKSGQMLRVQVDELQLVETELKRSCCREKASKALSVHMSLEFIQLLMTEASILGIENEILFMEISKMLAAAVSWEEQAKFVLGHVAHLPKFEDLIRSSKDISVILPSLPYVKDVVSFAQSWISRSQPYLASTMRDADAVGPLLKVDNLKELVTQSKFLKVTLEAPEKLESILKEVDEWAHSACSLLQHSNSLLYEHDEKFRIDSHLLGEIEGLLNGIDSALEIANTLRFEFSEALRLQHASLILKWSLKALSFCSRFPLWEEVDILLEDADNFPDTFSGNNLTKMLIEGANWLRKACTVVLESQSSKRCKLKDAEEILEESKRIVVPYPVMVAKLQNAIRKHESWVEQANAFFRHPGEQSWALLLKLKEAGNADAFDCPELDKVALEVEKVEKWMHECRVLVEPLVGKHGSLFLELTQIKDTLDRALSIYHSSKGCRTRTFCVCCAYKSENEEEFTCRSCDDRYHFSCIGPPFATEGMVNEYDCPLCLCMQNGTISRNGRRPLIRRGNRPDLNSFIQLLSVAMDFCAGIAERALLQEIVKLALDCKSCLGEIVNRSLSHRGKDVSSVSESLLRTLKAVAVAGVYDHQDGCSLYSALSKHSWKIRVAKLLRDPKKPVIQQIQHLLREGLALGVPYEDHFMKEITKVQKISLQWADIAKKVASDLGALELSEVYKLIDEGETLPVLFEKEMKLLKTRGVLYCICRKPYDQRAMIACDQCDEWYHFECIHLLGPPPKKFFCPACKPTNGEFISLPPSIHHKERSSNKGELWTPPTCLNESRIRLKSTNSQREMLVSIDLCNILKCCNEIDRLWRENRRPLQRITRKRCNTESLSFFPISRCK